MKSVKLAFCLIAFLLSSIFAVAALDVKFTTAIGQSPDPAVLWNEVTFTVSFKPSGGAVSNFKIIGGVDGTQIFERTYASILADKIKTDSFKWTATAGSHKVWFELDPSHTAGDSDYANNKVEKAISGTGFILNDKTKPNTDHLDQLGNNIRGRLTGGTDLFVNKVWVWTDNQWFNFSCEWKRTGPQPPGNFKVELSVSDGSTVAGTLIATGLGKATDTTNTVTSTWVIDASAKIIPLKFKCILIWDDPGYKDAIPGNNSLTETVLVPGLY